MTIIPDRMLRSGIFLCVAIEKMGFIGYNRSEYAGYAKKPEIKEKSIMKLGIVG